MRSSHGTREPRVQREPERLAVRTVPLPDPGDLLSGLPEPTALAWVRHGEGLAGWGETARITLPAGQDRFTAGEKSLRELFEGAEVHDEVGVLGTGPVAFGSFTFDPTSDGSVLVVPATVLGRREGRAWLTTIRPAGTRTSPAPGPGNGPVAPLVSPAAPLVSSAAPLVSPAEIRWHDGGLAAPDWERAVATAVARIREGRLRKVVLARDVYATASADFDTRALLRHLSASYPDCYTFACAGLIGATPELLIRRQDDAISSLVLAGTVARGRDAEEDALLGARLLSSAKDTEEHGYAVAGVRAALTPLCDTLTVDAKPSLLQLANVQHLATAVTGTLTGRSRASSRCSRWSPPSTPPAPCAARPPRRPPS